jgi:hypothetical protein
MAQSFSGVRRRQNVGTLFELLEQRDETFAQDRMVVEHLHPGIILRILVGPEARRPARSRFSPLLRLALATPREE